MVGGEDSELDVRKAWEKGWNDGGQSGEPTSSNNKTHHFQTDLMTLVRRKDEGSRIQPNQIYPRIASDDGMVEMQFVRREDKYCRKNTFLAMHLIGKDENRHSDRKERNTMQT